MWPNFFIGVKGLIHINHVTITEQTCTFSRLCAGAMVTLLMGPHFGASKGSFAKQNLMMMVVFGVGFNLFWINHPLLSFPLFASVTAVNALVACWNSYVVYKYAGSTEEKAMLKESLYGTTNP